MLSWWKGQTVGKRIMKIRVLRLDGEPITWWTAFERAGGYAAGFATGLWASRRCSGTPTVRPSTIASSGTVVVQDGAAKVLDWEERAVSDNGLEPRRLRRSEDARSGASTSASSGASS